MTGFRTLILPGWNNSGPEHWQTRWEHLYGYHRVQQHDWAHPLRGDWTARLQDEILDSERPTVLVAHSLGCILAAWWASHSPVAAQPGRIKAALLVAPADVERPEAPHPLQHWLPIAQSRLPFPTLVVASSNDPYCSLPRAQHMAQHWGAACYNAGDLGHINDASGLGDWPEGHALLQHLLHP